MSLYRIEVNVSTGARVEIQQLIYSNPAGAVVLVDYGEAPPDGYSLIDEPPAEDSAKVFSRLLSSVNADYQKDVESYNKAFSLAIMFDGATEEAKKTNIRAQYSARKVKYAADVAALRAQYGA